jgi:hypothetical protein
MPIFFKMSKYDPSIDSFGKWRVELDEMPGIEASWTAGFATEGVRCVHQRDERTDLDPKLAYNLQVWKGLDGRLLAKVWVDGFNFHHEAPLFQDWFEVVGYESADLPRQDESGSHVSCATCISDGH